MTIKHNPEECDCNECALTRLTVRQQTRIDALVKEVDDFRRSNSDRERFPCITTLYGIRLEHFREFLDRIYAGCGETAETVLAERALYKAHKCYGFCGACKENSFRVEAIKQLVDKKDEEIELLHRWQGSMAAGARKTRLEFEDKIDTLTQARNIIMSERDSIGYQLKAANRRFEALMESHKNERGLVLIQALKAQIAELEAQAKLAPVSTRCGFVFSGHMGITCARDRGHVGGHNDKVFRCEKRFVETSFIAGAGIGEESQCTREKDHLGRCA
jgi:hypothetical protein